MLDSAIGGRPRRPLVGYAGSSRARRASHGTTLSMSARNTSRRVRRFLASKFNDANVACFISDGFRIGGVGYDASGRE